MGRDKEIKLRNAINTKVMDSLREAFPNGRFKEFKYIPRVSGYVIWDGFEGMTFEGRMSHLKRVLGSVYDDAFLWTLTPAEWKSKLEERANPID